jgi:hypothetical protein
LEKAFDLIGWDVIWQVLEECKIPKKIVNIINGLIRRIQILSPPEGKLTYSLEVTRGVRQGCRLCLTPFLLVVDSVVNKVMIGRKGGIQWRMMERLDDVDFADKLCLLAQIWSDIKAKLKKLENEATEMGLKIN